MELKDIKNLPFNIKWKEINANCIDDGRQIFGTSFDNEYCFSGHIVDHSKNLRNSNPTVRILYIYKKVREINKRN